MFNSKSQLSWLFTLSGLAFIACTSAPWEARYVSNYLCSQRLQYMRHQKFFHWPGLQTNASLELPTCGSDARVAVWYEGHEPTGRRRLPITDGGSLFDGCVDFRRRKRRDRGLQLSLRPDRCRKLKDMLLSLTCVSSAAGSTVVVAEVHALQLDGDRRCPPGTGRNRLGLCRQCGNNSGGDRCCWQPFWDAGCPLSCKMRSSYDRSIGDDSDDAIWHDVANVKPKATAFPRLLRRGRRDAKTESNSSSLYASTGQVKVAQLACPNRIWVVATVTCLMEMYFPTRGEVISLMVAAFTTLAFMSMPILVGYTMGQVYSAQFLPFLQFHLFERSALLSSSMRTQSIFAPSLWDFKALREAEKQRRLVKKQIDNQQMDSFRSREFQNLLLWNGVPE